MMRSDTWNKTCAVLVIASTLIPGCRNERYYGPYRLEIPTEIMEKAAGRTFQFPLDDADRNQLEVLESCQRNEPADGVPCMCDHPVLTVNEQQVRIDYQVSHLEGTEANVMVWVGSEVLQGETPPEALPDLPQMEVFGEHHHQLATAETINDSLIEEEMRAIIMAWTNSRFPECGENQGPLPAPLALVFGAALDTNQESRFSLEFTIRVCEGD